MIWLLCLAVLGGFIYSLRIDFRQAQRKENS